MNFKIEERKKNRIVPDNLRIERNEGEKKNKLTGSNRTEISEIQKGRRRKCKKKKEKRKANSAVKKHNTCQLRDDAS